MELKPSVTLPISSNLKIRDLDNATEKNDITNEEFDFEITEHNFTNANDEIEQNIKVKLYHDQSEDASDK